MGPILMSETKEETLKETKKELRKKRLKFFSASRIILIGFIAVILVGTLLLMLPVSTVDSGGANFYDAWFTATSATCVTGLVTQDTATYWSTFGQVVILVLIQIGGMGVVTVAITITRLARRRVGLVGLSTMQESVSAQSIGGIANHTKLIVRTVFCIEGAGAVLLAPVFISKYGALKGIWFAVFHSVSAFCNAGFDLMGDMGAFSSFTSFSSNAYVNIVVILLIVTGGIGFLTWDDIRLNGIHVKRYRMQTKVVLLTTAVLIVLPFLYFFFVEMSGANFSDLTTGEKILASLFQTVTPRTAGFNTIDLNLLSEAGKMLLIMLMLAGGSSGSTAGGMKITTVAVLFASVISVFRKNHHPHFFGRRVENEIVKVAASIFIVYIMLFTVSGMAISLIEGLPLLTCLFETASAIATVGLTLGITSTVSTASGVILIALMFLGRVGALTVVYATLSAKRINSSLPKEKIMVG